MSTAVSERGHLVHDEVTQRSSSDQTLNVEHSQDSEPVEEKEEPQGGDEDSKNGDEENIEGPPLPVGFWDKSLSHVRKEVVGKWALTSMLENCLPRTVVNNAQHLSSSFSYYLS